MTTLTLIIGLLAVTFATVWLFDRARQEAKKSDRKIVRRVQRYLDQLPPADPGRRGGW